MFLAGGVAQADGESGVDGGAGSSQSADVGAVGAGDAPADPGPSPVEAAAEPDPAAEPEAELEAEVAAEPDAELDAEPDAEVQAEAEVEAEVEAEPAAEAESAVRGDRSVPVEHATRMTVEAPEKSETDTPEAAASPAPDVPASQAPALSVAGPETAAAPATETEAAADAAPEITSAALRSTTAAAMLATEPVRPTLLRLITSLIFGLLSGLERLVNGPAVVPAGSTVTVRSSSLQITDSMTVPVDWYFPTGGEPPQRLILLQHGFLAIGPMYSYTAARLAERTHSIVLTPTLNSNSLADGGLWLGGTQMHAAVAALFTGDRAALTASAIAAGFTGTALPTKFGLTGHSLGGALVSGVAGYLAGADAAADLVGVILLDGVPLGDQLSDALVKLDDYEQRTGIYVPVRAISAPLNYLNMFGNTYEALSTGRPDRFKGVVLRGGVHMDAMRGPNPIIQFAAFLAAGFPQSQNPPAVEELSATWFADWFGGHPDVDDDLEPGSTFTVDTPNGPATATVIGTPVARVRSTATRLVA